MSRALTCGKSALRLALHQVQGFSMNARRQGARSRARPAASAAAKEQMRAEAMLAPGAMEHLRVGPAGWSYPDWVGVVYPAKRPAGFHEAAFLAGYFDTIEINTSFYQPLKPEHCAHWIELVAVNPRFRFTAKLWQKFTHEPSATVDDEKAMRAGFDVLRKANKLGAALIQFPFSFHRTDENWRYLDGLLDRFRDYPLVVEVRHATWNDPAFFEFLAERGVGFCNIDQPLIGRSLKPSERATGPVGYVRLHGRRYDTWFSDDPSVPPSERYNYLYSETELKPWVERIRGLAAHARQQAGGQATDIYVVTNNHYQGKAVVNALQLISLLKGVKVKVPETLRHRFPQLEEIASEPTAEPTLFPMDMR
jgi:uncharacterized protein YecE (DUF72 family)